MLRNRIDENQKAIVDLFRKHGATVFIMDKVKGGFPDLVVCYRGNTLLVEVKGVNGTLTEAQKEFFANHSHYARIVRTEADVLKLLDTIEKYLQQNQSISSYLNGAL
jgi:hypothetical protein